MNPLSGPILYLTGEYPRATDTFIQREVAALRSHGFEIATASIRRTGPEHIVGPEQKSEQAQTFHVLERLKSGFGLTAHLRALRNPGRYLRTLALAWRTAPKGVRGRLYNLIYFAEAVALARHAQEIGAAHIHNHIAKASCTVAMLTSELSEIPYSFTLHGPDIFFEPYHWRLDEKIARAEFVACISDFARSQAMFFSDVAHWPKLHIVHCGVDPDRYQAGPAGGKRLLFVGRLAAVKGIHILLEALASARQIDQYITLSLIGDGPDRPALEAQARQMGLGDAVTFLGYQSQSYVAEALGRHDALVLPSFAEGVPVVLMEAMAAARPVVATRVGGVAELVEDGVSGRLVAPGNPEVLCAAIHEVLGTPEMGAAGRAKVVAEFDSQQEAAWLGVLICAGKAGDERPGVRP